MACHESPKPSLLDKMLLIKSCKTMLKGATNETSYRHLEENKRTEPKYTNILDKCLKCWDMKA